MWLDHLPASAAFCDVETTGFGQHDRVVSFGVRTGPIRAYGSHLGCVIGMISRSLGKNRPSLEYLYLVFDPGRSNHCNAERIHGFSVSALRLQDPFAVHA